MATITPRCIAAASTKAAASVVGSPCSSSTAPSGACWPWLAAWNTPLADDWVMDMSTTTGSCRPAGMPKAIGPLPSSGSRPPVGATVGKLCTITMPIIPAAMAWLTYGVRIPPEARALTHPIPLRPAFSTARSIADRQTNVGRARGPPSTNAVAGVSRTTSTLGCRSISPRFAARTVPGSRPRPRA